MENKVSLHEITKDPFAGPIYHAGVDTIDGFCKSWHKELTEAELDAAYEKFLVNNPDINFDLNGGDIEEFDYSGYLKSKKFLLEWLRYASKLKKLELWDNEIVTIENLSHLKELEILDLSFNKI